MLRVDLRRHAAARLRAGAHRLVLGPERASRACAAGLLIFVSFAAGLFLGVPIVARELERGTARLAWSLTPSRMRWYLARMLPVLVVLALVTFLAGVAADRFVAATTPMERPVELVHRVRVPGPADRQPRGLRLRGRRSPSARSSGAPCRPSSSPRSSRPSAWPAARRVHQLILASEAVAIPMDPNGNGRQSGRPATSTRSSCCRTAPSSTTATSAARTRTTNGNPKYPIVMMVVPGERYRFVETREALALAGGSLVALVLAGFVVSRRRPG